VKYELEFYIPEDGFLHIDRRHNLKSYITYIDFGRSCGQEFAVFLYMRKTDQMFTLDGLLQEEILQGEYPVQLSSYLY
jgi:hypothetical protein